MTRTIDRTIIERPLDVEAAVRGRYAAAARAPEADLCCPTSYDRDLLSAVPPEVLEIDYGCGDPTRHLGEGETVLDLGSGAGKHCFMAAKKVGPPERGGRVIGVDVNDEMLAVARRNVPEAARRLGYANVEFRKGRIQDLALDLGLVDEWLARRPVRSGADLARLDGLMADWRRTRPLVADASVDVVVSNCVLNLVREDEKAALFREILRVLKPGGRAVVSDIVADEDVPADLKADPDLWSGCVSGAFREDAFLAAFEAAGFVGIEVLERRAEPWRVVEGIEFRSMTVRAWRGGDGPCLDGKHAVVYRGPFREIRDDDGHVFPRGERIAVCERTYRVLTRAPYAAHFDGIPPRVAVEDPPPFPCANGAIRRHPRETKGLEYKETTDAAPWCEGGDGKGCC